MRLTNQSAGPVYWRVFGPRDTVYLVGRWDGTIATGASATFDLPEGELQLEIKENGAHVIKPGKIWKNSDALVFENGGLSPPRLTFIEARPSLLSTRVGLAERLSAIGFYNDQTNAEIAAELRWASVPAGVVTIDAAGIATAIATGKSEVRGHSADGLASTIVEVTVFP